MFSAQLVKALRLYLKLALTSSCSTVASVNG